MAPPRGSMLSESSGPALLAGCVSLLAACVSLLFQQRTLLTALLRSNQMVQALVASTLIGGMSISLVMIGKILTLWVTSQTFASITIHCKDGIFHNVIDFVGKYAELNSGALMAQTQRRKKTWKDYRIEFSIGIRTPPKVEYRPANNNDVHIFIYEGQRILLTRSKGDMVLTGYNRTPTQLETLTLSAWKGGAAVLKRLVDRAIEASFEEQTEELTVYTLSNGWLDGWEKALSKKPRPIESVILDEDLADKLLADARDFLGAGEWYAATGIPYRRGYLLYGPPGCGKTSFCQALAGELKLDVCMLTLSNKGLDDNSLAASLRDAPANAIVLLEDVDAVFVERSAAGSAHGPGVTFSGLLNALDGVASQEGRLFFMTTNYLDRLDPALVRPGRCDIKVELRNASHAQQAALFARFFPKHADKSHAFALALPEFELSMAQLQGYLLEHKTDPLSALLHVRQLLRIARPVVIDRTTVYEHLRRMGLERWASTFEHHGVMLVSQLGGVTIDIAKKWSAALRADQVSARRLELLLARNEQMLKHEYHLADLATAKEMFLQTFAQAGPASLLGSHPPPRPAAASRGPSAEGSPLCSLQRSASDGLGRVEKDESQLSRLCLCFCAAVQREGKGAASVFQLARHLRLYDHDATLCVERAPVLVAKRPAAHSLLLDVLPVYEWLRRAGLEAHACSFENAGYDRAEACYNLSEAVLKEKVGLDGQTLSDCVVLLGADEGKPDLLVRLVPPDWRRLRTDFAARFAPTGAPPPPPLLQLASLFADALSDAQGCARISLVQLSVFLAKHADGGAVRCLASTSELLDHVRAPRPPPVVTTDPEEWVFGWLKAAGLARLSDHFLEHNLSEKESLLAEPHLQLVDLVAIGVTKAGDQRKVLALIARLRVDGDGAAANGGVANGTKPLLSSSHS